MYDYWTWTWTCSRTNQGWENNFNIMEQQVDTQVQDQLMALNEIFVQGIEMMRQVKEESFANAQRMVEESTYQVRKEMMFEDEYEPLEEVEEEVQESLEVKEACETINLSSSIKLTCTLLIDSCVPFQYPLPFYILYEQEPKKEFLYQHHDSKTSFVDFMCQKFPYQVQIEDYHNQDLYVVIHVIYYGRKILFDKHLVYFLFIIFLFLSFCFVLLFLVT